MVPRVLRIDGIDHPEVRTYAQLLRGEGRPVGARVAVIGAGGIGVDELDAKRAIAQGAELGASL